MPPDSPDPERPRRPIRRHSKGTRTVARWMFHGHLWLGVVITVGTLIVCVTGVLLNHKRAFGLMPDVENEAPGPLTQSLPLADLVAAAAEVAPAGAEVDRMDVRPSDGLVKVRFEDREVTEVTVDLTTGRVIGVGKRNDVFLEKLHSGEIFGDNWILFSDVTAIALSLLVVSGYWIWLYPRSRT